MNKIDFRTLVRRGTATLACSAAALLVACGGGGGDAGMGTARIALTDAPACGYDHVYVTVQKVRVNASATASDTDGGWSDLTLAPAQRIDLLDLTNGVFKELGTLPLPAGSYSQVRLVLASNSGGTSSPANALVLTGGDGTEIALTTPSGQQSGTKIQTQFTVAANQVADLMLDFDACKSIVKAGASGQYLLKPVIRAIPVFAATGNAIVGYADPGDTVSAQQAGVPVKTTVAGSDGKFVLSPVMAGTYDLAISAADHASAVIAAVPVTDTAPTTIASSATPIVLPPSTSRSASGAATTTGSTSIPDATLRVVQKLAGGPNVELASQHVDSVTGSYSFTLPIIATGKAAYAAGATSYTFTADATSAAKYTLEAAVPGQSTQTVDIDLTTNPAVANFAFAP